MWSVPALLHVLRTSRRVWCRCHSERWVRLRSSTNLKVVRRAFDSGGQLGGGTPLASFVEKARAFCNGNGNGNGNGIGLGMVIVGPSWKRVMAALPVPARSTSAPESLDSFASLVHLDLGSICPPIFIYARLLPRRLASPKYHSLALKHVDSDSWLLASVITWAR